VADFPAARPSRNSTQVPASSKPLIQESKPGKLNHFLGIILLEIGVLENAIEIETQTQFLKQFWKPVFETTSEIAI
jgi:hypothetical protein